MTHSIEKRLGHLIGYLRRERLNGGNCAFKQENFIKSDGDHPFEGVLIGRKVCSLTTLSRLENGKHQNSYALLDYFLNKLGIRYKIKESLLEKETYLLSRITSGFASLPQSQVIQHIEALITFYTHNSDDILIQFNLQVVEFVKAAIDNATPQRRVFDALMEKIELYPPLLQQWLIDGGLWLKNAHPDFWNLTLDHHVVQSSKIKSYHQTVLRYDEPESVMILKTLIPSLVEESLIVCKLKEYAHQYQDQFQNYSFQSEYRLCLMSARNLTPSVEGSSILFYALKRFCEASDAQDKLNLFESQLLDLLRYEPHPKAISKALSLTVLNLCKRTKSYKPLVNIVELLNENNNKIDSLSVNIV